MIKEIFTVKQLNQYKFEIIVNSFIESGWELYLINTNSFSNREQTEVETIWVAILTRDFTDGLPGKEVERRAINKYLNQKEER